MDLCTGTGSVAIELGKQTGKKGLVIGLDFSMGMLKKAKKKAAKLNMNQLFLVQANAAQLPFKNNFFHGVTCSHAFYELKGVERTLAIGEVARVLRQGGRFCLMEHAKPKKLFLRILFYLRLLLLGSKNTRNFLQEEGSLLGERFKKIAKEMSPTGRSKLIYGEKEE